MTVAVAPCAASEPDHELIIEIHEMDNAVVWVAPDLRFAVVNAALPADCRAAAMEALVAFRKALDAGEG